MMSTELGNISGDFKKRLNELALDLGQNNHYAAFLHDCISREITLLKESMMIESCSCPCTSTAVILFTPLRTGY